MHSDYFKATVVSLLSLGLLGLALDADAARRSLRIEFEDFGWTQALALGSADCPGSTSGSTTVAWRGIRFSGGAITDTYNTDEYCQNSIDFDPDQPDEPYLNDEQLFASEDAGIKQKIGANNDEDPLGNATARLFSFLNDDRFAETVQGFQWEFFFFPGDVALVRLNGNLAIPDTAFYPYIEDDSTLIWDGEIDGYSGQFWCFNGGSYVGSWDGEPAGTSPLAGCEPDAPPPEPCEAGPVSDTSDDATALYEACSALSVGPNYTAESTANARFSAGASISIFPEFLVSNGAQLELQVCGQSLCLESGGPLITGCHSCVTAVCSQDSYCCDSSWDSLCVEAVASVCGLSCEAAP